MKKNKGITLVSLVVTIIVLIILAGVSINLILGENGLIKKAKETKPIVDISTAQEKLELVKGPVQLKKYSVNLDDYLEELDKVKEKYEVDYVEKINDTNAEIIIGGKYKFLAIDEENGNVKIVYQGETGRLEINPTSGTYKYPTTGTFEVVKNETKGELSVKSENENIATASISGTTVTVIPQSIAGTAKIVVTSAANGEYAQTKAIYTAIVENGEITLTADAYTGNYDGQAHDAVSNVVVTPSDAKLEYSTDEGKTFSTTIPKVNGATTYSVIIKASKAGYATKTITKTITVGKNTETGNLELSAESGTITYPNTGTFTVTKNTSGGTLSVTSSNTNVATASIDTTGKVTITPKAITTDNQQVTITVKSAATSNYTEQTKTYTATIKQGTLSVTATAYSGEYDGKAHGITVTCSGATITYSKDNSTFSSTKPTYTAIGTYTTYYKVAKTGYTTVTGSKTVTIKDTKAPNSATITISGTTTQTSLPVTLYATVTHSDSASGINIKSCKYIINTSSAALGTTASKYTGGTFSSNGQKITIKPSSVTNWYLHVLSVDNSGNAKETIKGPITIAAKYHTHTGNASNGGGCYTAVGYHSHTSTCTEICNWKTNTNATGSAYQANCPWCKGIGTTTALRYDCTHGNSKCTYWHGTTWYNTCNNCGNSGYRGSRPGNTGSYTWYTCGKTTSTQEGYSLACGKNTTTIEGYTISY